MKIKFILSLIIILFVGIFAIQNSQIIAIKFLFLQINISLALIILISFVIGGLIGIFISYTRDGRSYKEDKKGLYNKEKIKDKN
ncbi:LapA family protein [Clostridium oceanicum]|uniref:Lipopolysaccharide assembly protein A domain-containing protein n=1 Tax=Clostridium oceanicum TaxID=1543 RepID=A0ABP3USD8_9CLOT